MPCWKCLTSRANECVHANKDKWWTMANYDLRGRTRERATSITWTVERPSNAWVERVLAVVKQITAAWSQQTNDHWELNYSDKRLCKQREMKMVKLRNGFPVIAA